MSNTNRKYKILLRSLIAITVLNTFSLLNLFITGFYKIYNYRFGIGWPEAFLEFQIVGQAENYQLRPQLTLGVLIIDFVFWYAVVYFIEYLFNILRNLWRAKNEKE